MPLNDAITPLHRYAAEMAREAVDKSVRAEGRRQRFDTLVTQLANRRGGTQLSLDLGDAFDDAEAALVELAAYAAADAIMRVLDAAIGAKGDAPWQRIVDAFDHPSGG